MKTIFCVIFNCLVILGYKAKCQSPQKTPMAIDVKIDLDKTHQTIEHFGASDAWACQSVGLWPDKKRNAIADLLFSLKTDSNGTPKGIGLSLWRFNFGAGSAQQGEESGIKTPQRRAESFYDADGSYNWNRQKGQQWFLTAAKARGVDEFLGFFNSPPVQFTKNGLARTTEGRYNIHPEKYPAFSAYIVDVIKGINQKTGVYFDYISPVNEPQWDWKDSKQEGNPYTNHQIRDLVTVMNQDFDKKNISTKIVIPEAGKLNYLVSTADKPERGDQIDFFFTDSLRSLSHVANVVAGHSYFTTSPYQKAVKLREQLKQQVDLKNGLRFWMSEYCVLGDNNGEINGGGRDLGITSALYIAKVIHNDLVNANATAWHWWTAISRYNYKDGLIYIDDKESEQHFMDSKTLWTLGNYSRFVRPGFIRVETEKQSYLSDSLLVSAYKSPSNKQLVCVLVNSSSQDLDINLHLNHRVLNHLKQYNTSKTEDLKAMAVSQSKLVKIPAKSVVTIIGEINNL